HLARLKGAVARKAALDDHVAPGGEHVGLRFAARDHAKLGRIGGSDRSDSRAAGIGRRDYREGERQAGRIPTYRARLDPPGHAQHLPRKLGFFGRDLTYGQVVLGGVAHGRSYQVADGEHDNPRADHETPPRRHKPFLSIRCGHRKAALCAALLGKRPATACSRETPIWPARQLLPRAAASSKSEYRSPAAVRIGAKRMTGAEGTVLPFNIYHNLPEHRHLDRRLELIAQGIAERRPHVAALQELLRASACGDLGARLRDRVNQLCGRDLYRLDYCPADGAGDGEFAFDEGVGMLSRLDADGAPAAYKYRAQVDLSAMVGGQLYRLPDDRVVLHRRFRFDGGARMEVFVTHLT